MPWQHRASGGGERGVVVELGEGGATIPTLQPAYPFPLLLLSTPPHPSDPAAACCTVAAPVPDGGVDVVGALVLGEQVSLGLQAQKKIT